MIEQNSNPTEESDFTEEDAQKLIQWLMKHGRTYEEIQECINFLSGKRTKSKKATT